MLTKTLFDATSNKNYIVVGFDQKNTLNIKPLNNIGLYVGKQFYLDDVKYNRKIFFLLIDQVRYAIRDTEAKSIFIKE